jgi:hypothetical protein
MSNQKRIGLKERPRRTPAARELSQRNSPYNLQVGAAELGGVIQNGNYILAFAAMAFAAMVFVAFVSAMEGRRCWSENRKLGKHFRENSANCPLPRPSGRRNPFLTPFPDRESSKFPFTLARA